MPPGRLIELVYCFRQALLGQEPPMCARLLLERLPRCLLRVLLFTRSSAANKFNTSARSRT
jgi:hypothetical protein